MILSILFSAFLALVFTIIITLIYKKIKHKQYLDEESVRYVITIPPNITKNLNEYIAKGYISDFKDYLTQTHALYQMLTSDYEKYKHYFPDLDTYISWNVDFFSQMLKDAENNKIICYITDQGVTPIKTDFLLKVYKQNSKLFQEILKKENTDD